MAVYSTIKDYVITQDNIPKLSKEQQLALILDFDKN
jgi:hypothetical protein